MDLGISGKVALVTGASEGMGAAIARQLAEEGCRLVLIARDPAKLDDLRSRLSGLHAGEALPVACDVTSAEEVARAIAAAEGRFGTVDILINNAGGLTTAGLLPFEDLTDEDFVATYVLNVLGAVRFMRGVLPMMRRAGWGRIVNISSENGLQPDVTGADYNAAKAALNALSKTLSKAHAAEGVLVNTLSPGLTITAGLTRFVEDRMRAEGLDRAAVEADLLAGFRPNISVRRPGTAEEIAAAVLFLVSAPASFVNGANLRVDGGSVASIGG